MSTRSFGTVLTALLMTSGSAFADQFYFVGPSPGVAWERVYVNPYAADENTPPQNNPLTIYCDDWDTELSGNPKWNANTYALARADLTNFKFGQVTTTQSVSLFGGRLQYSTISVHAYDLYLEAVYLDQRVQISGSGITPLQQEELSAAEWTLFTSSGGAILLGDINNSGTAFASAVYNDLVAAQNAVANDQVNAAGWDVITPADNSVAMQEFLLDDFHGTVNGLSQVPEPGAVVLLGTVVGFLGWAKFRRGRQP